VTIHGRFRTLHAARSTPPADAPVDGTR
jgi:hypothetical protein